MKRIASLTAFAAAHGMTAVGQYPLHGHTLAEKLDDLHARLRGKFLDHRQH